MKRTGCIVAGRESFISDLDATRTLTSTNSQAAAADGQVAIDQVNLFLALGGGWEVDPQNASGSSTPAAAAPVKATPRRRRRQRKRLKAAFDFDCLTRPDYQGSL